MMRRFGLAGAAAAAALALTACGGESTPPLPDAPTEALVSLSSGSATYDVGTSILTVREVETDVVYSATEPTPSSWTGNLGTLDAVFAGQEVVAVVVTERGEHAFTLSIPSVVSAGTLNFRAIPAPTLSGTSLENHSALITPAPDALGPITILTDRVALDPCSFNVVLRADGHVLAEPDYRPAANAGWQRPPAPILRDDDTLRATFTGCSTQGAVITYQIYSADDAQAAQPVLVDNLGEVTFSWLNGAVRCDIDALVIGWSCNLVEPEDGSTPYYILRFSP